MNRLQITLPTEGNLQIVRRPFWQLGSDNILYVLNELKKQTPAGLQAPYFNRPFQWR
jgi:hypothetical protein